MIFKSIYITYFYIFNIILCLFSCFGGRTNKRYGICDDIRDYKISLKIYDGPYCVRDPEYFWKGRIRELDLSVSKGDQFDVFIDSFFETVTKYLHNRGATFVDPAIPVNKSLKLDNDSTSGGTTEGSLKRKY